MPDPRNATAGSAGSTGELYYVAGDGRSGSTLLGMLLARATDGFFCGELVLLWQALAYGWMCECGAAVDRCPVWSAVADEVRRDVGDRSFHQLAREVGRRLVSPPPVRGYSRLPTPTPGDVELCSATEAAIRTVTGKRVVVDTSKTPFALAAAGRLARPLTIVHLVRDPRAVAYSNLKRKPDPAKLGAPLYIRPPWKTSVRWLLINALTERVAADIRHRRPDARSFRVRYEDLSGGPATALEPIVGPRAQALLDTVGPAGDGHAVAGNPSRFEQRPIAADTGWTANMPPAARVKVAVMTGPLLKRYGYALQA